MSAHPPPGRESRLLKKRADYFFASRARSRGEVAEFAGALLALGPTVAIGGFLRDLCLAGNREFKSDVDFVVDPISMREFERMAGALGATRNKFGGYGVVLNRWKVDVWPLERTWAGVAGHVRVAELPDLLKVTFFDWDAVLYSVADQKLIAHRSYFERVRRRVIDVNLEPNPNPLGNAVRALRYAYRWDAAIGHRLAAHVARQVRDHGWAKLAASERGSFRDPILGILDCAGIVRALADGIKRGEEQLRLPLRPVQYQLPLACCAKRKREGA